MKYNKKINKMTPKEKAKELFEKYLTPNLVDPLYGKLSYNEAKQCALIAVEEIISDYYTLSGHTRIAAYIKVEKIEYWKDVKTEIKAL